MTSSLPLHVQLKRKMQLYSVLSTFFLINGLFVFLDLYLEYIQGRFLSALQDLSTYGIFLFPFLPGLILSAMAYKMNKQYQVTLNQAGKTS